MKAMSLLAVCGVLFTLVTPAGADVASVLAAHEGPITIKFRNWDSGTLYNVQDDVYMGESTLDGLIQTPPPNRFGIEDTWGVARLSGIYDAENNLLWSGSIPGTPEITGLFWGGRDTYLSQTTTAAGIIQDIHAVGMHIAFFEDANNDFGNPSAAPGTAKRTAGNAFTGATEGTLLWTLNTVPGFVSDYPNAEFFTTFSPSGAILWGGLNAYGGAYADLGTIHTAGPDGIMDTADDIMMTGLYNDLFVSNDNGGDWRITFTGKPDPEGTFLVVSDDPIDATLVPEPATMSLLALGLSALVVRRRRRS
jgi:PEP-CTERM motif